MNVKPESTKLSRSLVYVFSQFDPDKFLPDDGECPHCQGFGAVLKKSRTVGHPANCLPCNGTGWKDGKFR